jgi:hypothetical protein
MSKLTSKTRNSLSSSAFALPGKRMFPLTDEQHDVLAEQFADRAVAAGHITPAQAQLVKAEAKARLAKMRRA